jgi:hypothetical protein
MMHKDNLDGNLPFHVMLAYGPLGLVRATARQLHHDCMTVDTGLITLDEQAAVELSFIHHHHNEFVTHRIRARVSASSRGTAVLTFCDYARTTRELLRRFIGGGSNQLSQRYTRNLPHLPIPAWQKQPLPPSDRLA